MPDTQKLPDDHDVLRAMVTALQVHDTSIEKALKIERAKNSALDQHIATLTQQLATRRRARYGRSSEQLYENVTGCRPVESLKGSFYLGRLFSHTTCVTVLTTAGWNYPFRAGILPC